MSLRQRREALGMTQVEVAERAGLSSEYYSQIERGRIRMPNIEIRREISRVLGMRHIDFMVAVGELGDWELPGFNPSDPPTDLRLENFEAQLHQLDLDVDNRSEILADILQLWSAQDRRRHAPPLERNGTGG